jgi:hypothetical protein
VVERPNVCHPCTNLFFRNRRVELLTTCPTYAAQLNSREELPWREPPPKSFEPGRARLIQFVLLSAYIYVV